MDGAGKQPVEMGPLFRRAHTDPLIARAVSHPRRMAVLAYLMHKQDEASDEAELAELLTLSLPAVRYHLTVLRGADLITCVETGATARYIAAAAVDA